MLKNRLKIASIFKLRKASCWTVGANCCGWLCKYSSTSFCEWESAKIAKFSSSCSAFSACSLAKRSSFCLFKPASLIDRLVKYEIVSFSCANSCRVVKSNNLVLFLPITFSCAFSHFFVVFSLLVKNARNFFEFFLLHGKWYLFNSS